MKILLQQDGLSLEGQGLLTPEESRRRLRQIDIVQPASSEGLSLTWSLNQLPSSVQSPAPPKPKASPSAQPGSSPAAILDATGPSLQGSISLAGLTSARRLTLPVFWPSGELYLSNTSAIWLSEPAFAELKQTGKTNYSLGLLDNPLLGPMQGLALLEESLSALQRFLEKNPEEKETVATLELRQKSLSYRLKINGQEQDVPAIEAGNGLGRYVILDNPYNPLVLEVNLAPAASASEAFFSPLVLIRSLLSYRVIEIDSGTTEGDTAAERFFGAGCIYYL